MRIILLGVVLLLAACAPHEQPYAPPHSPPKLEARAFAPGDGAELPLRHWKAKTPPRAIVIAVHGFNDYGHAFEDAAHYFAKHGIDTYAYDQRGFGANPSPGLWGNEQNLVSDTQRMVEAVRAKHPGVPLFLLGESMGGAVTIEAMASDTPPEVRGVILVAPAVWGGEYFGPLLQLSLWVGAHTFPEYELTGKGLHVRASDNLAMLIALGHDPLVLKRTRIDAVYGLTHLMDHAYGDAEKLDVPTLLLYGKHDQVIPPEPVKSFAARLQAPHEFIVYPDGWHMLLRDMQAKVVWRDIVRWIDATRRAERN